MIRSKPSRGVARLLFVLALAPGAIGAGGCNSTATPQMNATIPETGLVVVSSDYSATSVSLIDPVTRAVTHDHCVDSNTVQPMLSLALSGDVSLPSGPQIGGDVVLLDDVNSALTWVDPQGCTIRHQLSVSDFKSYPHDVISISDEKSYVTRFGTNANPTSDEMSRGEDILIVNPKSLPAPSIIGRIDLAPFAATVAGAMIQARPDRGLFVDGKVYVTLASQSTDYTATGGGRIVIVDVATDQVSGMIELTGLAGCSRLDYLASARILFVACGGASSDADQAATSGVALVDLSVGPPSLKSVLHASALGGKPLNFSWVVGLPDRILAATFGAFDFMTNTQTATDVVWSNVTAGGAASKLIEGGAFNLGRTARQDASGMLLLFIPDADPTHPLLHVINAGGTPAAPIADIDANPSQHLPPREIAWY